MAKTELFFSTYIVTVPQQIRPGEDAEIYIAALRPVQEQVRIGVTLMDKDNKTIQLTGPFELINRKIFKHIMTNSYKFE